MFNKKQISAYSVIPMWLIKCTIDSHCWLLAVESGVGWFEVVFAEYIET